MNLNRKQIERILHALGEEAIRYVYAADIMSVFEGHKTWSECFKGYAESSEAVSIVSEMLESGGISEEEMDEVLRPFISGCIAEALSAKKVTIKW